MSYPACGEGGIHRHTLLETSTLNMTPLEHNVCNVTIFNTNSHKTINIVEVAIKSMRTMKRYALTLRLLWSRFAVYV